MKFHLDTAEIFVPDGLPDMQALARTTHLCLAAHQDDIEILAPGPILECYQRQDLWFTGVVVTDGRGSPRSGCYANYDDEQMRCVRFAEQRKAATVGEFAAQVMLDFPSRVVKGEQRREAVEDIGQILRATRPRVVYTHNLCDKHDTHVAVALRVIEAVRSLPLSERPERLYGGEVWRALDWMDDADKVLQDTSARENLQAALIGVFDSQIAGGKRYDLAALGRRRANATFFESHGVDRTEGLAYAMDLTPLLLDEHLDAAVFTQNLVHHFVRDVQDRLSRLM